MNQRQAGATAAVRVGVPLFIVLVGLSLLSAMMFTEQTPTPLYRVGSVMIDRSVLGVGERLREYEAPKDPLSADSRSALNEATVGVFESWPALLRGPDRPERRRIIRELWRVYWGSDRVVALLELLETIHVQARRVDGLGRLLESHAAVALVEVDVPSQPWLDQGLETVAWRLVAPAGRWLREEARHYLDLDVLLADLLIRLGDIESRAGEESGHDKIDRGSRLLREVILWRPLNTDGKVVLARLLSNHLDELARSLQQGNRKLTQQQREVVGALMRTRQGLIRDVLTIEPEYLGHDTDHVELRKEKAELIGVLGVLDEDEIVKLARAGVQGPLARGFEALAQAEAALAPPSAPAAEVWGFEVESTPSRPLVWGFEAPSAVPAPE